ncbi:MAG: NAD-dependent DNA ligase LigA [Candidatus Colwellbacteria bacterium CG10_big_fil_rev_8_21_14_0_10_42_22]|uniref:DNA ligase n=1 Tax=Candidatus Colwellbacteria bacterium CG10_big_fil_rev_8_21_14_0_10_42_22 TaxID=1974540 RepID=A0A2H0VG59_9BACT|nr:MAG: NAD-dependent DNA ligase LigA [Candidatus Colwellbacteria bacterium CG10_big_fil_rev_8_21_14_0_10_42_22]
MDKSEIKSRIEKLKKEINRYRYAYHVEDRSLIPDSALDTLKKELFDLEQSYPDLVTSDSPTQRMGGEPTKGFKRVRHERRMTSFNDAFSREDVKSWLERAKNHLKRDIKSKFYIEPKIDGFAIELVYESGILVQASTRGDGIVGEDVTENIKTVEAIPLSLHDCASIKVPEKIVVRGEVFITLQEFENINREQKKQGVKEYANPRNIAAGTIRQLDPKVAASRKLDSFAYALVTDLGQKSHADEHALLHKLGFKTGNINHRLANSLEDIFKYRDEWEKKKDKLTYQIDGIVVVINDISLYEELGVVGKAPRGAIAYKFSPEEATTKVRDIKIQVGRTGALTPVAFLESVEVGGVTIQHATLHNFDQIERLDVRIGDTVIVSRAGDVIPQVTKVLENLRTGKEKKFSIPEACPIDGSKIIKDGVIHRCSNVECGARLREGISHFVSRSAFDIRGLGQKIVEKFIEEGFLSDVADIFHLEHEEIAVLPGFGEKSAHNIIREIEESRRVELPRFIYSLGIFHIGEETSISLANKLSQEEMVVEKPSDLIETLGRFSLEELMTIPDIGPRVGESIYAWFRNNKNQKLLKELDEVGIEIEHIQTPISNKLRDKTFVITGTLDSISRDEAKAKLRQLGGHPSESVSSKTDYVVAGDNPGSKVNKARKLGIDILTEKEFMDMLS